MSETSEARCDGSAACPAWMHVHGCYRDYGDCDARDEHPMHRWYEQNKGRSMRSSPSVLLWMPSGLPAVRLQTFSLGYDKPDALPQGPAVAYIAIDGVEIGHYLDDLELLHAAIGEELVRARKYHDELRAMEKAGTPEPAPR